MPLLHDNQTHFFIAERAASGTPPHVSLCDPKHTLGTLLTAAGIRLGRVVGLDDVRAARAVSMISLSAAVGLVWSVAVALTGRRLAGHVSALTMLTLYGLIEMAAMGARPKVMMVLFIVLTFLAVLRNRPFWAGMAGGMAYLCWQPALLVLILAGVPFLYPTRRWKNIGLLLSGLTLPNLAYEGYFAWHGVLVEQLKQSYVYAVRILSLDHRFPADATDGKSLAGSALLTRLTHAWEMGFGFANVLPWVFLLIGFVSAAWILLRPHQALRLARQNPGMVYFVLCANAALAYTLLDFQAYPDLFLILPIAAIAFGAGVAWVDHALAAAGYVVFTRFWRATISLGVAGLAVMGPGRTSYAYTLTDQYALGHEIGRQLDQGLSVYAVRCTHLLAFNHVDNHVKYGLFSRGWKTAVEDEFGDVNFFRPLKDGKMPDLVITDQAVITTHRLWLTNGDYEEIVRPKFTAQNIRMWKSRLADEDETNVAEGRIRRTREAHRGRCRGIPTDESCKDEASEPSSHDDPSAGSLAAAKGSIRPN